LKDAAKVRKGDDRMAVIINEFEVISEGARQGAQQGAQPPSGGAPAGPTPWEIAAIIRHQAERLARVEAH